MHVDRTRAPAVVVVEAPKTFLAGKGVHLYPRFDGQLVIGRVALSIGQTRDSDARTGAVEHGRIAQDTDAALSPSDMGGRPIPMIGRGIVDRQ